MLRPKSVAQKNWYPAVMEIPDNMVHMPATEMQTLLTTNVSTHDILLMPPQMIRPKVLPIPIAGISQVMAVTDMSDPEARSVMTNHDPPSIRTHGFTIKTFALFSSLFPCFQYPRMRDQRLRARLLALKSRFFSAFASKRCD